MEYRNVKFALRGEEIVSAPAGFSFRFLPSPEGYVLTVCVKE